MDWANALWAPEDADALHGFLFHDCDSQIVTFVSKMDAYDWPHTGRPPTAACFSEQASTSALRWQSHDRRGAAGSILQVAATRRSLELLQESERCPRMPEQEPVLLV